MLRNGLVGVVALLAACSGAAVSNGNGGPAPLSSTRAANAECGGGTCTIESLLQGKSSGLEVRRDGSGALVIRIRGIASINGTPAPLILLDGIEYTGSTLEAALSSYTPADIRSVQVLKNVSETSSYGMRAAGGVILITTVKR